MPSPGATCHTPTRRSGSANGSGLRTTPLTTLKITALAPIAAPMVISAVSEKAGLLKRRRRACRILGCYEDDRHEVRETTGVGRGSRPLRQDCSGPQHALA